MTVTCIQGKRVSSVRLAGASRQALTAGTCAHKKPEYREGLRGGRAGGCECYSGGLAYYLGGVRSLERQCMRDINRLGGGGDKKKVEEGGGNKYTDDMIKKVNGCVKLVKIKLNGGHNEVKQTNTRTLVNDPQTIRDSGRGIYYTSCVSITSQIAQNLDNAIKNC